MSSQVGIVRRKTRRGYQATFISNNMVLNIPPFDIISVDKWVHDGCGVGWSRPSVLAMATSMMRLFGILNSRDWPDALTINLRFLRYH
jgi:hypothetical protein